MESYATLVKGYKSLTIVAKRSILMSPGVVDMLLVSIYFFTCVFYGISNLVRKFLELLSFITRPESISAQCYIHIETSHLICSGNQMTSFYMKFNTRLKRAKMRWTTNKGLKYSDTNYDLRFCFGCRMYNCLFQVNKRETRATTIGFIRVYLLVSLSKFFHTKWSPSDACLRTLSNIYDRAFL